MTELEEIEQNIRFLEEKIIEDFNGLYGNDKEMHDKLIKISTAHPEQEDLIKFILFLNDNLNTTQKKGHEITVDNLSNILENKKRIIKILKENSQRLNKQPFWKKINFKDAKIIAISISITVISLGLIFFPEFRNDFKELILIIKRIV